MTAERGTSSRWSTRSDRVDREGPAGLAARHEESPDDALGPPEVLLGFLLNQLGGVLRERTARMLEPLGMSPRSLGLLLALADNPGASQIHLVRRLRIDRTTMSQLVEDLTRAKLVKRTSLAADRRNNQLALTAKGFRTVQRGAARALEVEQGLTETLEPAQLASLKAVLRELLEQSDAQ